MLTFEILVQLIYRRRWRWLIATVFLFGISIVLSPGRANGLYSAWDYLLVCITQQFNTIVLIPCIFLFLVADLILGDFNNNFIAIIFPRLRSRGHLLLIKCCGLFSASMFYSLLCFGVFLLTGLMKGMSLTYASTQNLFGIQLSFAAQVVLVFILFVTSLTSFGSLITTGSLLIQNLIIPWTLGAMLCCISYILFMLHLAPIKWLPSAQMMLLIHLPNHLMSDIPQFGIGWTCLYNSILFACSVCIAGLRLRSMNIQTS